MYKKYPFIIIALPLLLSAQEKSKADLLMKILTTSIQNTIRYKTLMALACKNLYASPALVMND